jgi:hypothetical protein
MYQLKRCCSTPCFSVGKRILMFFSKDTTWTKSISKINIRKTNHQFLCAQLLQIYVVEMAKYYIPKPTQSINMCNERGINERLKRRKLIQSRTMIYFSRCKNNFHIFYFSNVYTIRRKLYCFPITRMRNMIERENICIDVRNKKNIINAPFS